MKLSYQKDEINFNCQQQNQLMHYSFKSTPTATFKSRTQTVTKANQLSSIPGPADYNVNKPLPKSATIAQTKSKRQLWKFNESSPGPGAYQPPSYITNGQKRSMSAKLIRQPPKIPGPGSYQTNNVSTLIKAPVFSMGNKSKSPQKIIQQKNTYKPSPDLYESPTSFNKSVGVIFGSSSRRDLTETQKTPAPGYYQAENTQLTSMMNPRCAVGSQKRQLKITVIQKSPGPGQYQHKNFFEQNKNTNKGFTCKQKLRNFIAQEISKFPGPGQYQSESLKFKLMAPRPATVLQKRSTFIDEVQQAKKQIPAFTQTQANFFNISKYRASSACNFGKSRRKSLDQNQMTPGPMAYSSDKLQIMRRKPSFSCPKTVPKNQFLRVMDPENPGPGQYNPKDEILRSSSQSTTLTREKRPNFDKQKQKPGPGQYNLIKQKQPKFSWTKEKRISFTELKNESKNGTHYDLKSSFVYPPSYMNVNSKVDFSPMKSALGSTGF